VVNPFPTSEDVSEEGTPMKRYLMPMAVMLAGCSAEMSATTPAPNASYVAPRNVTEAEAGATATQVCGYYHSEPAVRAGNADTLLRFECTGRARGVDTFFVERMGL